MKCWVETLESVLGEAEQCVRWRGRGAGGVCPSSYGYFLPREVLGINMFFILLEVFRTKGCFHRCNRGVKTPGGR